MFHLFPVLMGSGEQSLPSTVLFPCEHDITWKLLIASAFSAISPYEKEQKENKDITSAITYWTAKDMMPVSKV